MALRLPITLVVLDCVNHELARLSIEDTLRFVIPDQVVILTDDASRLAVSGAEYSYFQGGYAGDFRSVIQALWYHVPLLVRSDHWVWIQWDSGVINPSSWTDEFLKYDYIGAPWPCGTGENTLWDKRGFNQEFCVGNGGFSLRSREMTTYLMRHRVEFPYMAQDEDGMICKVYRPMLEKHGFRWPSVELAYRFSFEFGQKLEYGEVPAVAPFGFHNCVNWMWAMPADERERRMAAASGFTKTRSPFLKLTELHARWKSQT